MKKLKKSKIALLVIIAFTSCVNLKHVNDFSTVSLEGITSFEDLNYNFKQYCLDKCIDENINQLNIHAKECDCTLDKKADKITLKIYISVKGYFIGLSRISDNELTGYQTEELKTALIQGDFGAITVAEKDVTSYSKLSEVLINAFTYSYKKSKIKEYVKEANTPIKTLLQFLNFNLSSNLNGKLNVKKNRLKSDYFDLLNDKTLSEGEKRNFVASYYSKLNHIKNQQKRINTYARSLKKIAKGHQKLYDNIDKLKVKEIKNTLFQYASEIDLIISEFKTIEE